MKRYILSVVTQFGSSLICLWCGWFAVDFFNIAISDARQVFPFAIPFTMITGYLFHRFLSNRVYIAGLISQLFISFYLIIAIEYEPTLVQFFSEYAKDPRTWPFVFTTYSVIVTTLYLPNAIAYFISNWIVQHSPKKHPEST